MSSLLVASLAMAALTMAHHHARELTSDADFRRVQLAADAGLEWAVSSINSSANWRTNHTHNVDSTVQVVNGVNLTYRLLDDDGDLADNPLDPCDVLVTASLRESSFSWRAALEARGPGMNCLDYSATARNNIEITAEGAWSTDGPIASTGLVSVDWQADVTAECFASGGYAGLIHGGMNGLIGTLEQPDASVLEHYSNIATPIDSTLLRLSGSYCYLEEQLLSNTHNTISGEVNSSGVYSIDCLGRSIVVTDSRIAATLVLTNVGADCSIYGSVHWTASISNYPILLIDGNIDLSLTATPLLESTVGLNLNPSGMPYRGQTDSTTTTAYPSELRGLLYAAGRVSFDNNSSNNQFFGSIVSYGMIRGDGDLRLIYRDIFAQDPPPGFRTFEAVRIGRGSIRRVATP